MEITRQLLKPLARRKTIIFINSEILKKEKECEQVVFIKGWKNNVLLIEMAGGEFCGNAVRAVLRYVKDKYNISSCKIKYKNYNFFMKGKCNEKIAEFSVKKENLINHIEKVETGEYKIRMNGITHYVILESSEKMIYFNNKEESQKFINSVIEDEKCFGVMYLKNNLSLFPYVYVQDVNTMFFETACGSGTIACAEIISKLFNKKNIAIKQPSGYIT